MCRRVSPRSFKYFIFSSVIFTALLIYSFGISWGVVYTADSKFAKDSNTFKVSSWQSWQNDRLGDSMRTLSDLYENVMTKTAAKRKHRTNGSAIGSVNRHSSRDEYWRFRNGGVKDQNTPENTTGGSLKLTLKPYSAITSPTLSKKRTRTFTDVNSAKGKLNSSVYGEVGCPDNPWRKALNKLLRHWIQISKQNKIEYVLACGSLLGAMRDGDIIPYDSDIDILVDQNYFSIFKRLSSKRGFSTSDEKIRLVVQPEFTLNIPVEVRKRFTCQGEVRIYFLLNPLSTNIHTQILQTDLYTFPLKIS